MVEEGGGGVHYYSYYDLKLIKSSYICYFWL